MSRDYLNMRCEKPWLDALDSLACKLRLGNRSRVVDLSLELLADMAGSQIPPRVRNPEHGVTDRFTPEDKARLLENANRVLNREVHDNGIIRTNKSVVNSGDRACGDHYS